MSERMDFDELNKIPWKGKSGQQSIFGCYGGVVFPKSNIEFVLVRSSIPSLLQARRQVCPSDQTVEIVPSSSLSCSFFQISVFFLHSSSACSPAAQAACRCGAEAAIKILSSPMGTFPMRCTRLMAVRACCSFTFSAIECMVLRARAG